MEFPSSLFFVPTLERVRGNKFVFSCLEVVGPHGITVPVSLFLIPVFLVLAPDSFKKTLHIGCFSGNDRTDGRLLDTLFHGSAAADQEGAR